MPSCGCCDLAGYDNTSMLRGVGVLWRKLHKCDAEIKECRGSLVVGEGGCRFYSLTYFATSMPSCGCCDLEGYNNTSMLRGVEVLWRKLHRCDAKIKEGRG